jgi:hypothetical protein
VVDDSGRICELQQSLDDEDILVFDEFVSEILRNEFLNAKVIFVELEADDENNIRQLRQ